jgi:hypothetical protein
MSRNDARDFAQRLYARIPANYRAYDVDRGQPLLALITVVAAQVANVRQNLDSLWDDFFIETCQDWAVPYLGALVGTNLLQMPVGQSNRLDVWNTVLWRRSKGTPAMLEALAQSISGWPADLTEFFQALGWSQNMNHVRLDRPLNPDLREPARLRLLGSALDPLAHAADFKPAGPMDQPRTVNGVGPVAAWGTPGRYQIKNLGLFARRLASFPVRGASASAAAPGATPAANNTLFKFHPLFRDVPLFAVDEGTAISRSLFAADPWLYLGGAAPSIAVRQFGVPLAVAATPSAPPAPPANGRPFQFGGITAVTLDATAGMRILDRPQAFQLGALHFVIGAQWAAANGAAGPSLGAISTLAFGNRAQAFVAGGSGAGAGQLAVTVQLGRKGVGFTGLAQSTQGRFPGAVMAIRAARTGGFRTSDAIYVYLPPAFVTAGAVLTYYVGDDGSTYTSPGLTQATLARASEGPTYPAFSASPSTRPTAVFNALKRTSAGMILPDPARFGGAGVVAEAAIFTGAQFQTLGAVTSAPIAAPTAAFPDLQAPTPWPAFTYAPSRAALNGTLPSSGTLTILLQPIAPNNFIPAAELVLTSRAGQCLLVYLPEVSNAAAAGVRVMVADDGSTYFFNQSLAFNPNNLARASLGQALPIPGIWPIQQRYPVAGNLCRVERTALLTQGQLGIDPELGRFALPAGDPALAQGNLSVDFVESFGDAIGATSAHATGSAAATRWISQSGDAPGAATLAAGAPVHTSLGDALANARDGDVIEIVDSGTYFAAAPATLSNAAVKSLTIRAAEGQRPCFTFYSGGAPAAASLTVATPLDALSVSGILVSGGPVVLQARVGSLALTECTLDPTSAQAGSLLGQDANLASNAAWLLSRCITGGLIAAIGTAQMTVTDSIVDRRGAAAIAGLILATSPPGAFASGSAKTVQLERVTVFGQIWCEILKASESLLDDLALVADQQSGCVRFTRFERGSTLPRRYQCMPNDAQSQTCGGGAARCLPALFNSRIFGRPEYAQLASNCPREILTAGETGSEVGAFAGRQNTTRRLNLQAKLREFMPVGLTAVVVAES